MKPIKLENESGKEISLQTAQPQIFDENGEHQAEKEICLLIGDKPIFLTAEQAKKAAEHMERLAKGIR